MPLAYIDPSSGSLGTHLLLALGVSALIVSRRWIFAGLLRLTGRRDWGKNIRAESKTPSTASTCEVVKSTTPTGWTRRRSTEVLLRVGMYQLWALVLFFPTLGAMTLASNRYFLHWDGYSAAACWIVVTAVGLGLFLVGELLGWLGHGIRARVELAGVVITAALLFWPRFLKSYPDLDVFLQELPVALIAGMLLAVAVAELRLPAVDVHRWITRGSKLLSPAVVIYWACVFSYPTQPSSLASTLDESAVGQSAETPTPTDNVYLFIIDGWTTQAGFNEDGLPNPELENLRALADASTLFTAAHSPSCYKLGGIPRLLYQRTDALALSGDSPGFWDGDFQDARQSDNLFRQARAEGYHTSMIGWLHPYRMLLGDSVDYVHARCLYRTYGQGLLPRIMDFSDSSLRRLLGEELSAHTLGDPKNRMAWSLRQIREDLLEQTAALVNRPGDGQFAVIQIPGAFSAAKFAMYEPDVQGVTGRESVIDERNELEELDDLIGQLADCLEKSGKLAGATLVFTSDRGFAAREADVDEVTHVPLLVRFPGQSNSRQVAERFTTSNLWSLLESRHQADAPARIAELVRNDRLYEELSISELRRYRFLTR